MLFCFVAVATDNECVSSYMYACVFLVRLCGFEPFFEDHDADMYVRIIRCEYDFPAPYWDHVSEAGKVRKSRWKFLVTGGSEWGLFAYVIVHTILPPSPVILWIELGGKPKWLPLNLEAMMLCTWPPFLMTAVSQFTQFPNTKLKNKVLLMLHL